MDSHNYDDDYIATQAQNDDWKVDKSILCFLCLNRTLYKIYSQIY